MNCIKGLNEPHSANILIIFNLSNWRMSRNSEYKLRPKAKVNILEKYQLLEEDFQDERLEQEYFNARHGRPRRRRKNKKAELEKEYDIDVSESELSDSDVFDENFVLDRLPDDPHELKKLLDLVKEKSKYYKQGFLKEQEDIKYQSSYVGDNAIPICADVTTFNWASLIKSQMNIGQRMFDVIMMDPPWKLSTSQPSRGVAIQYDSLSDENIERIPIEKLQHSGFLLIWTINAKLSITVKLLKRWNYKVVDSIAWVKSTVNSKIAKGHGFYLQHAKETCIIGVKGTPENLQNGIESDLIFSMRRGQSQKPCETYSLIEKLVPNGFYLQIFGRRNNLRDKWVTIGNQI